MKTKKRRNFDSRLIFIGVSALIIIAAVVSIVLLKSSAQIEYDIVYSGISGEGLIIRQESFTEPFRIGNAIATIIAPTVKPPPIGRT